METTERKRQSQRSYDSAAESPHCASDAIGISDSNMQVFF